MLGKAHYYSEKTCQFPHFPTTCYQGRSTDILPQLWTECVALKGWQKAIPRRIRLWGQSNEWKSFTFLTNNTKAQVFLLCSSQGLVSNTVFAGTIPSTSHGDTAVEMQKLAHCVWVSTFRNCIYERPDVEWMKSCNGDSEVFSNHYFIFTSRRSFPHLRENVL